MDGANIQTDPEFDESAEPSTPNGSESGESSTALLPLAFFEGKTLEPGGRCEVEIVRVHDDQAEVRYVGHEEAAPEPEAPADTPVADAEFE